MKKIFTLFLVIIISLMIFLLAGEWYLRNFTHYGVSYIVDLETDILSNDSEILWEGPDEVSKLEPYLKKSSQRHNEYRILVLGDSIALGGELKEGELAFPAMLENILNKNYKNHKFKVLTYGSGGYTTLQEVRFYETKGKLLKPNLLILAYCYNDAVEAFSRITRENGRYIIRYYKSNIPYLNKIPFNRYLTERFLLFKLINEVLINLSKKYNFTVNVGYCLLPWERIYRCFERLYKAAEASESSVAVVVFPPFTDKPPHVNRLMHELIKKWCKEFNFLNIDLSEKYKEYNYLQLRVSLDDDCHPNEFGHKIAAEFIAEKLKQSDYLLRK